MRRARWARSTDLIFCAEAGETNLWFGRVAVRSVACLATVKAV
jgi:hypothetical protein